MADTLRMLPRSELQKECAAHRIREFLLLRDERDEENLLQQVMLRFLDDAVGFIAPEHYRDVVVLKMPGEDLGQLSPEFHTQPVPAQVRAWREETKTLGVAVSLLLPPSSRTILHQADFPPVVCVVDFPAGLQQEGWRAKSRCGSLPALQRPAAEARHARHRAESGLGTCNG